MGQYWKIVNLDKREVVSGGYFGDGAKFLEMDTVLRALAVLVAAPESMGAGGGDARRTEMTGRWAGDRIVIVGDYTDTGPHAGLYYDDSLREIGSFDLGDR